MKEYFEQIDSLRQQLAASREKNGIYIDPQDFYNMEAKLASQENHIAECESTIRQRELEVKLVGDLKKEVEEKLEGKLEEISLLEKDVEELGNCVNEVRGELVRTKGELESERERVRELEERVRERETEIENLKREREELRERVRETERVLQERERELQETRERVRELEGERERLRERVRELESELAGERERHRLCQRRLLSTYAEGEALRREREEQRETEKRLRGDCEALQTTLQGRECEINRLLEKVRMYEERERESVARTETFVRALSSKMQDALTRTHSLLSVTERERESVLREGEELLEKSRKSLGDLTGLVQRESERLVAESASNHADLCVRHTALEQGLVDGCTNARTAVSVMQSGLEGWLDNTVKSVQAMQGSLSRQREQQAALLGCFMAQGEEFRRISGNYVAEGERQRQALQTRMDALGESVVSASEGYGRETEREIERAKQEIERECVTIEHTVAQLLQGLRSRSLSLYQGLGETASAHVRHTVSTVREGEREMRELVDARGRLDAQHAQTSSEWLQAIERDSAQRVREIDSETERARETLDMLPESVTHRRTESQTQSTALLGQIEDTLSRAQDAVNALTDVSLSHSERVKTLSVSLASTVERDLRVTQEDREKEIVSVRISLQKTGEETKALTDAQCALLSESEREGERQREIAIERVLRPRGDTPVCLVWSEERVFAVSRESEVVREEVLQRLRGETEWRERMHELTSLDF